MMKLVALSLLVCEGNAFQNLGARVDELEAQAQVVKGLVQCLSEATAQHCDQTCADVIAISSRPFPTIESGTRYEVDGCVEIKILRRVRDACSMAWRCRGLAARQSQHINRLTR